MRIATEEKIGLFEEKAREVIPEWLCQIWEEPPDINWDALLGTLLDVFAPPGRRDDADDFWDDCFWGCWQMWDRLELSVLHWDDHRLILRAGWNLAAEGCDPRYDGVDYLVYNRATRDVVYIAEAEAAGLRPRAWVGRMGLDARPQEAIGAWLARCAGRWADWVEE